jgi:hypothetical protein
MEVLPKVCAVQGHCKIQKLKSFHDPNPSFCNSPCLSLRLEPVTRIETFAMIMVDIRTKISAFDPGAQSSSLCCACTCSTSLYNKSDFCPRILQSLYFTWWDTLVGSHHPTHRLIERDRIRYGGGANVAPSESKDNLEQKLI